MFRVLEVRATEQGTFDRGKQNGGGSHDVDSKDSELLGAFFVCVIVGGIRGFDRIVAPHVESTDILFVLTEYNAKLLVLAKEKSTGARDLGEKAAKGVLWNCLRDNSSDTTR